MATFKSLGWDFETPPPRKQRTDAEILLSSGDYVTLIEEGQTWIRSDYLVAVTR